jgi:lipopolysaccharide/colanic/teichoic acid biosynthesis glycosyltransferase
LVYLFLFLVFRVALFKLFFSTLNKARSLNKNAVILGINEESKKFYDLKDSIRSICGLNIVGFIGPEGTPKKKIEDRSAKLLGNTRDIMALSDRYKFKDVFFINSKLPIGDLISTVERLRGDDFFVHVSNLRFEVLTGINQFEVYGPGNLFVDFSIKRLYYKKLFKFLFDYIFSIFILIVISPFLLLLMLMIKLTSKGPALFIGKRIGLGRKEFNFIKFRSMKHDTEENIRVHRESIKSFYNSKESGKIKVYSSNQRITRVGRFLRKFSLDELPQFINVLKGDMSIVGPRPCMKYEAGYFKDWREYRFDIKPGITGLWQAYGRSKVNFEKLSILEYYYYSNCSFSLDLKILFDTIKVMILGIGGY